MDSVAVVITAENLRRMGATVEVRPDGFDIPGRQRLKGAELDSFGDQRIAMAFTVAALARAIELKEAGESGAEYQALLRELEELSDEEARALLAEERDGDDREYRLRRAHAPLPQPRHRL